MKKEQRGRGDGGEGMKKGRKERRKEETFTRHHRENRGNVNMYWALEIKKFLVIWIENNEKVTLKIYFYVSDVC